MNNKQTILDVIRETRQFSLPSFGLIDGSRLKDSSPASVVTEIDEKIEKFLKEKFADIDNTIEFVGEEFGGDRTAERFWLTDPIDGTGHFVRGTPFCTTMVALIEGGQVTFSAIYDFVNDVMYHAELGGGAFENDTPIKVSTRPIEQAYVSFETRLEHKDNVDLFLALRKRCVSLSLLCSGYEHVLVAKGVFDARIVRDGYGQDYDFAPGALLIKEAGGIVTNIGKDTYDYRDTNFIAANPRVYAALTEGEEALFKG